MEEDKVINENEVKSKRRMAREEKKKKKIKKIFLTILTIIILAFVALIINDYIIIDNNKTTNLVINNNNITANLKNDIIIEDNIIYLSKSDIANFFDPYIYDEKSTNQIITSYDKKIATIGFNENKIIINGSRKNIYAHAIKKNNTEYLPISEMKDVYNIEIQYIEDTNIITMDSLNKEKKLAIVSSNLPVKSSTNFISKTVDRIKKGDTVITISSNNGYTKIRTQKGKVGYVKSDKLENEYTIRETMTDEKQVPGKINLTWDYFSTYSSAPDRTGTSIDGINVVSPSFFYLDSNGNFKENIGNSGQAYIEWAHEQGYKVWPMFTNGEAATNSLSITSDIMNNYKKRQELIEKLVTACVKYRLDGINIDFENMKQEDKDMFSRFIIELTPRIKEIGLVTSVDVTAPDGGETWSMCFDRHVIGNVADYIVFMAYDEYGISSTTPGTTAGYDWVKLSLNKFLQTEEIDSNKIILAVPFYTRIWTTDNSGKVTSTTVSLKKMDSVLPENIEKTWNDELKQNYAEYTDNSNKKQIWIEDADSLKAKLSLINENNLAGVGSWQKEMASDEIWGIIKENINIK